MADETFPVSILSGLPEVPANLLTCLPVTSLPANLPAGQMPAYLPTYHQVL